MRLLIYCCLFFLISANVRAVAQNPTVFCSPSGEAKITYKDYICPLGGEKFRAPSVETYTTHGRHFDFSLVSQAKLPNPLPVCPSNGFVIYKEKYSNEELRHIGDFIRSEKYRDLLGKHTSRYLQAKILQFLQPNKNLLHYYLMSSWEAYNCDQELYREYAQLTLNAINLAIEQTAATPRKNEFWAWLMVRANLHRRLGEFEKSIRLIDAAINQYTDMPKNQKTILLRLRHHANLGSTGPKEIRQKVDLQNTPRPGKKENPNLASTSGKNASDISAKTAEQNATELKSSQKSPPGQSASIPVTKNSGINRNERTQPFNDFEHIAEHAVLPTEFTDTAVDEQLTDKLD